MNHEWANNFCGNCKITRSKTAGGTTKYLMPNGKTRWTPGPCVAPGRLDPNGDAEPKTILTGPVEGKNGPTHWAGPATTHIDTETGKRTALRVTNRVEQTPEPTKQPELPAETMGKIIMPGHALDGMKASLVQQLSNGGFDVRVRERRGVFAVGCVVECQAGEWEPS